jgi:hypothetical protein
VRIAPLQNEPQLVRAWHLHTPNVAACARSAARREGGRSLCTARPQPACAGRGDLSAHGHTRANQRRTGAPCSCGGAGGAGRGGAPPRKSRRLQRAGSPDKGYVSVTCMARGAVRDKSTSSRTPMRSRFRACLWGPLLIGAAGATPGSTVAVHTAAMSAGPSSTPLARSRRVKQNQRVGEGGGARPRWSSP